MSYLFRITATLDAVFTITFCYLEENMYWKLPLSIIIESMCFSKVCIVCVYEFININFHPCNAKPLITKLIKIFISLLSSKLLHTNVLRNKYTIIWGNKSSKWICDDTLRTLGPISFPYEISSANLSPSMQIFCVMDITRAAASRWKSVSFNFTNDAKLYIY